MGLKNSSRLTCSALPLLHIVAMVLHPLLPLEIIIVAVQVHTDMLSPVLEKHGALRAVSISLMP